MDAPARAIHPLLVIALVLAAVCGYLAGSHRVSANTSQASGPAQVANAAGLLLEYPVGWERAAAQKSIPGLSLAESVTLSPRGEDGSGLLTGMLAAGTPAPLPASFLERLSGAPHAEVVSLVSTQAYRYSGISLPGYSGVFDLYAIPAAGSETRVMACFAPKRATAAGQQCERIVANVTLTGTAALTLTPSAAYAEALAHAVSSLNASRAHARRELADSASAPAVVAPAQELAARYRHAAHAISTLEAPAPAAAAQVALSESLTAAGRAYAELAAAAEAEGVASYDAAREQVTSAEQDVDSALESLALLGYGPA